MKKQTKEETKDYFICIMKILRLGKKGEKIAIIILMRYNFKNPFQGIHSDYIDENLPNF